MSELTALDDGRCECSRRAAARQWPMYVTDMGHLPLHHTGPDPSLIANRNAWLEPSHDTVKIPADPKRSRWCRRVTHPCSAPAWTPAVGAKAFPSSVDEGFFSVPAASTHCCRSFVRTGKQHGSTGQSEHHVALAASGRSGQSVARRFSHRERADRGKPGTGTGTVW